MTDKKISSLTDAICTLVEASGNDLQDLAAETKKKLTIFQSRTLEASKEAVKSVNTYAHQKPWVLVGLFSFLAGIFGFYLSGMSGRKLRKSRL